MRSYSGRYSGFKKLRFNARWFLFVVCVNKKRQVMNQQDRQRRANTRGERFRRAQLRRNNPAPDGTPRMPAHHRIIFEIGHWQTRCSYTENSQRGVRAEREFPVLLFPPPKKNQGSFALTREKQKHPQKAHKHPPQSTKNTPDFPPALKREKKGLKKAFALTRDKIINCLA